MEGGRHRTAAKGDRTSTAAAPSQFLERIARLTFLGGVLYAALAQGAFYRHQAIAFWPVVIFAGVLAATAGIRRTGARLSLALVWHVPLLLSTVLSAVVADDVGAALPTIMTIVAVAAALVVGESMSAAGARRLLDGLTGVALVVAATAIVGVVHRHEPWGRLVVDLWRGSSSLTYSNAAAALIVPALLVAISRLVREPGRPVGIVVAHLLVVGTAATASRGGALALAVGLVLLAACVGVTRMIAVLTPVVAGSIISAAAVLSMAPVGVTRSPLWAWLGLAIGLVVSLAARSAEIRVGRMALGTVLVVAVGALAVALTVLTSDSGSLGGRVTLDDQNRADEWRAAWREFESSPVLGVGPGKARFAFERNGDFFVAEFAHQEYLELVAEQGVVGLLAALVPIGGLVVWLSRRFRATRDPLTAGTLGAVAAFLVHSGLDFLWHIPLLPVFVASFVGVELSRRRQVPTIP